MKLHFLSFTAIFVCARLFSQDYLISFTGSGFATNVETVRVNKIGSHDTLVIGGNDTLHLVKNLGILVNDQESGGISVYPNPVYHETRITFSNDQKGLVQLRIFDFLGKQVLNFGMISHPGVCTFIVSGLKQGIYLLRAEIPGNMFSARIVSQDPEGTRPMFRPETWNGGDPVGSGTKSTGNIIKKQYQDGDRLLFIGKSGDHRRVITLVPTHSQTLDFKFVSCMDGDNNHYPVVTIGDQTWMAENLKATKFLDGSSIPNVQDNTAWEDLTTPGYCWYNNDEPANRNTYGGLYNWYSASNPNICPAGWHVPSREEWMILFDALDGLNMAGGKLKETNLLHWMIVNNGATNEAGFTARPGGYRFADGVFKQQNFYGVWYSTTEYNTYSAWKFFIYGNSTEIIESTLYYKPCGFSIRCLKNEQLTQE